MLDHSDDIIRNRRYYLRKEVNGMRINGPNQSNFNPYTKQVNKQAEVKNQTKPQDKVEISSQAKQMQSTEKTDPVRQKMIEELKIKVESGNYQADPKETAKNMLNFWSNKN
ncbi:MAG: flagellar biosynthesis anti-sigma factor FlgM [Halobacillus sp.]|uniref:flagellar biosynthesis anti-sigma factor FlgM n=1 Tax=Halobacillus sp. TaxID=56800 RepID=UPI003BB05B74